MSAREKTKHIVAFGTESFLTTKALNTLISACNKMGPLALDVLALLGDATHTAELAAAGAGNITVDLAQGSAATIASFMDGDIPKIGKVLAVAASAADAAKDVTSIENHVEQLKQSEDLKKLEYQCNQIENTCSDRRLGSRQNKPDLSTKEYYKLEQEALQKYEEIRQNISDITNIAKNTGIDAKLLKKIKEHVFLKKYFLNNKIKAFDPDIDMADAWSRLCNNTFMKSDLEFLKHEYAESILMATGEMCWRNAHDITNTLYNWMQYLEG